MDVSDIINEDEDMNFFKIEKKKYNSSESPSPTLPRSPSRSRSPTPSPAIPNSPTETDKSELLFFEDNIYENDSNSTNKNSDVNDDENKRILKNKMILKNVEKIESFDEDMRNSCDSLSFGLENVQKNVLPAGLGDTGAMKRTVSLITAHKLSIAEMVEIMKDEMQIVQNMEHTDDRDCDVYLDKLGHILDLKSEAISTLRRELQNFKIRR